jgi:hypothetical protein
MAVVAGIGELKTDLVHEWSHHSTAFSQHWQREAELQSE